VFIRSESTKFYIFSLIFLINDIVSIATFVAIHVFRLQYPGRYCSGAFDQTRDVEGYLTQRGAYLLLLSMVTWTMIVVQSMSLFYIKSST
jgi:hypothetical protein